MADVYDLIVVGGGPAGESAAITAVRGGARVVLLERGKFPRHKVCGEFVSAESLELLSSLLKGIKYFSIRQYALGLADSIAKADPSVFKANLDGGLAIPLLIAVTAAIVVFAVKRLETFEVRGLG